MQTNSQYIGWCVSDPSWATYRLTYDGSVTKFYKNGVYVSSSSGAFASNISSIHFENQTNGGTIDLDYMVFKAGVYALPQGTNDRTRST